MINSEVTIVIIDDDEDIRESVEDLLLTEFSKVVTYASVIPVLEQAKPNLPWVILTDLRMPDADGLEFSKKMIAIDKDLPVILMTGYGDISTAVEAIKYGIYDFIEKPFDSVALVNSVNRAVEKRALSLSLNTQQVDAHKIDTTLVGNSPQIRQMKRDILELAPMNIPVMIYGETGTGKELVAQCLHDFSTRSNHHFVALNCAAIPHELAESELFGHSKGAFTDAKNTHEGKLRYANEGTFFLDEVESLSLSLQAKLLRALSNNKVTPVGSNQELDFNCRIISASKEALRDNPEFRQDLFFRLQVAEIRIPPLRERGEDIIALFELFNLRHCAQLGTEYAATTAYAQEKLLAYDWPGNVRELLNISTRFALKHCNDIDYAMSDSSKQAVAEAEHASLKQRMEHFEAAMIRLKLHEHRGKVSAVLEDLQIERRTFNQKIKRYDIHTTDYRS